jgi:hypothetical protein
MEKRAAHGRRYIEMQFFGQTLRSFRVYKQSDGKYLITAQSGPNWPGKHWTRRLFDPETNELEMLEEE